MAAATDIQITQKTDKRTACPQPSMEWQADMRTWIEHFGAAWQWSASGVAILFRGEVAARMELAAAIVGVAWLIVLRRSPAEIGVFGLLAMAALAVEALNTAIETIVDEISPQRSEFARRAKDLGSAAVFFMLTTAGIYIVALTAVSFVTR